MKAYNKLNDEDKNNIIESFYNKENVNKTFKEMALECSVSERAYSRVLKENNINGKNKNRYKLNESYFENIDTERKAYWLGLLYADGYVGDKHFNNIIICLTISDMYILQEFSKDIEFTGNIRIDQNGGGLSNGTPKSVLNFSSVKMAKDLRRLGLYPGKSQSMTCLPNISEELIPHFIRGYFDGDGSIHTTRYHENDRGKMRYRVRNVFSLIGTVDFLNDVRKYIPVKLTVQSCKSENMEYAVCNVNSRLMIIYEYLYSDATIYFTRKFNKWNEIIRALEERFSMEKQGEPNTGCIIND